MEDLQSTLQSIMSDPEQMQQIFAMANSLGLQTPPGGGGSAPSPSTDEAKPTSSEESRREDAGQARFSAGGAQNGIGGIDPNLLQLAGRLGGMQGPEERVLNALRPVLSEQGQGRIDRALRAARLSRLAGVALKGGLGHV